MHVIPRIMMAVVLTLAVAESTGPGWAKGTEPAAPKLRLPVKAARAALDCGGFVFLGKLVRFEVTNRGTRSQGTLCTFLVKEHLAGEPTNEMRVHMPCGRRFAKRIGRLFVTTAGIKRAPWAELEAGQDYVVVPPGKERQASAANAELKHLPRGACRGFAL